MNQSLRIVFVGSFALSPKAGVSQRALPLARALVRAGHQVWLIVPPYDNPSDAGMRFVDSGVQVENLLVAGGLGAIVGRLVQRTLAIKPDVVHAFKPVGPAGAAAAILNRLVPVVLDCDDWEGSGGWADSPHYSGIERRLLDAQERFVVRQIPVLTVASRALVQRFHRLGIEQYRQFYLPNCADQTWATNEDESTTENQNDPATVLFLGHVPLVNDLDLSVKVLAPLAERGLPFHWSIVGDGPGLAGLITALPTSLGERTAVTGREPHEAIRRRYQQARFLLVTARDTPINRAKCPMKVVDALTAGLPVVAPDIGQHREYIVHGQTGLLAPSDDIPTLQAAVIRLVEDRPLAEQLGRQARSRMLACFTWDRWVGVAEASYQAALAGRRAP